MVHDRKSSSDPEKELWNTLYFLLSAGWIMVSSILGGTLAGVFLDRMTATSGHGFAIAGIIAGVGAGYLICWKKISGFLRKCDRNHDRNKKTSATEPDDPVEDR